MLVVVERETGLGRYQKSLADGLLALRTPDPFLRFCVARHHLNAARLVAPRRVTSAPTRNPLVLLPLGLPVLAALGGAQGVVPVLRPGRWPLAHDSLGAGTPPCPAPIARCRLRHYRSHTARSHPL